MLPTTRSGFAGYADVPGRFLPIHRVRPDRSSKQLHRRILPDPRHFFQFRCRCTISEIALCHPRPFPFTFGQRIFHGIHLGGVHHAGTRALIPRRKGKISDEGHPGTGFQGQKIPLVFQQHGAFGGCAAGQSVVSGLVKGCGAVLGFGQGQGGAEQPGGTGVHGGFRQAAGPHRLHQPLGVGSMATHQPESFSSKSARGKIASGTF